MRRLQSTWGNRHVDRVLRLRDDGHVGGLERRTDAASSTGTAGSPSIQRRLGDGHDLVAGRFAGDPVLEACFDNERLLASGARGPAVLKIQQALIDAGFPLARFGADGVFGAETDAALRLFTAGAGGAVDGLVGPETMGALDARFAGAAPVPPTPTPPVPTPPTPTPPTPTPPTPTPPTPTPPAPVAVITSETVATAPGVRTRTTVGVGEDVHLTNSTGSATWSATAGKLSSTTGTTVLLTMPDTARTVTVTAGTATLDFTVLAPNRVHMDRFPGSGVKHRVNRSDSGIETLPFLLPDTVNFSNVIYRELDVAGVPTTPGAYSCNTFSVGHCGAGGGGAPCGDLALTSTVVGGKGTQAVLGDCAYSGHCGGLPPFVPGSIALAIPYEYKVGAGPFRRFDTVAQVHALAADAATLTSDKAGAHGDTTVTSGTNTIAACP